MVVVRCKTNLAVLTSKWPTLLPAVPVVGQKIESWGNRDFNLTLEVVSVTWKRARDSNWFAEIELHIPKNWEMSIKDFYHWYAPKVGKEASYFI